MKAAYGETPARIRALIRSVIGVIGRERYALFTLRAAGHEQVSDKLREFKNCKVLPSRILAPGGALWRGAAEGPCGGSPSPAA